MLGGSQVAAKVLHESDGGSFAREIAILRSCRHSNIVQFLVRMCQCCLRIGAAAFLNAAPCEPMRLADTASVQGVCVTRQGQVMLVTEYMSGGDLWHALGKPAVSRGCVRLARVGPSGGCRHCQGPPLPALPQAHHRAL